MKSNHFVKTVFSLGFAFGLLGTILLGMTVPLLAAPVVVPVVPALSAAQRDRRLAATYRTVRFSFWKAENQLSARAFDDTIALSRSERMAFFAGPLDEKDVLAADYRRAAKAADGYIALAGKSKIAANGLASMLYLGAVAHYTLGNKARALECFERLQKEFPDYQRNQYINDRSTPDPRFAVPARPGVSKLILQLRLQSLPPDSPDAFAALQQITSDALTALSFQREYKAWVASHSDQYNIRSFEESFFGSEPDQMREPSLNGALA